MKKRIFMLIAVVLLFLTCFCFTPGNDVYAATTTQTGTVTANKLNLRTGAGVRYKKVAVLTKGDTVIIKGTSGKWYKVKATHNSKTYNGYVSSKYVKIKNTTAKKTTDKSTTQKTTVNKTKKETKVIYLTFDDGPGKYTKKLLDVLDKYDVKATFFVTNQYPKYQNMIKEEAKRGHTVALHTYSHAWSIYKSETAYYNDFNKMQAIIKKQTGKEAKIIRFPGGSSNTVSRRRCKGIMTKLTKSVQKKGYVYTDWNVSSGDAGGTTSTSQVVKNVINGCKNNDVSVVLQHDIKGFSVNAVEEIIKWGLKNGYTFKAMDENSTMVHHPVNN